MLHRRLEGRSRKPRVLIGCFLPARRAERAFREQRTFALNEDPDVIARGVRLELLEGDGLGHFV